MMKWIIALAAASVAMPAQAHWQYTHWGMTPAQVIAASEGSVGPGTGEKTIKGDATVDAAGQYISGDYKFSSLFVFNASGLSMVDLSMKDNAQCLALQRDLLAKYGEPVEFSGGSMQRRMWADKTASNRVVLITSTVDFCDLQYAPLITQGGAGL